MGNGGSISISEGRDMEQSENQNGRDCEDLNSTEITKGLINSFPLAFTPQIPVASLEKQEGVDSQSGTLWMNNSFSENQNYLSQKGVPTMLTWTHGGIEVFVEGSWDNWASKKPLQRCGKEFSIMKVLASGCYQCRFVVDGEYRYTPELPLVHDEVGNIYNLLDVQENIPDYLESVSGFDPPQSPETSYNNVLLNLEDFMKMPPAMPPQLNLTVLDVPKTLHSKACLPRAPHVILNHLYIKRSNPEKSVVAIGETCRFLTKNVTVVLYKSLQG
ncbi:SNF1-related protein kinase regulatory subunit beta-2-like protein [Carex littledalei]|uniref:SNF1-related protein kinase regulatory subunit beta-2-like protein n=1 Tax=Carex littledalei TaxID=544730 RepID=A0A833UXY1_9POAL|nr:SNF1-related protein kinase regulatory subunit beta-2-like protein [Carex littledalei]